MAYIPQFEMSGQTSVPDPGSSLLLFGTAARRAGRYQATVAAAQALSPSPLTERDCWEQPRRS